MQENKDIPLIILDKAVPLMNHHGTLAFWELLDVPEGAYSLTRLIDEWGDEIKNEYLAFVYELGKQIIRRKSIQEHLLIRKQFSFWWLTLISEKHHDKSPSLHEIFKIRAAEKLYHSKKCQGVVLYSDNLPLHRALKEWCEKNHYPYRWIQCKTQHGLQRKNLARRLMEWVPFEIKAILNLFRFILIKRHLFFSKPAVRRKDNNHEKCFTILSYFPNLKEKEALDGVFMSNYWQDLHLVFQNQMKIDWVFIYAPDKICKSEKEALNLSSAFQKKYHDQSFSFIEQWFSWSVFFETLKIYFKVVMHTPGFSKIKKSMTLPGSEIPVYPLLESDWKDSIYGWRGMSRCLYFALHEAMARKQASKGPGLYLLENNAWERGMTFAWKAASNTPIAGYQHSALRELDLRFCADPRTYLDSSAASIPLPTVVAVNGEGAFRIMVSGNFPAERLFKVEAIRYPYLNKLISRSPKMTENSKPTLLVVTDNKQDANILLMKLLDKVFGSDELPMAINIVFKPHPFSPVDKQLREYAPQLNATVSDEVLSNLLPEAEWVLSANYTTSALEAAMVGLPVMISYTPGCLNMSPLRGYRGVRFIANEHDLLNALRAKEKPHVPADYFILNNDLPCWKRLIQRMFEAGDSNDFYRN